MATTASPHIVRAYNTAKYDIQVHRPGLTVKFQNRLHDDDVAKLYGFEAGLVPGVDLYAYLAHPAVERWGRAFLERGVMSAKFTKPVYDNDVVSVSGENDGQRMTLSAETRGAVCAVGTAELAERPIGLPDWSNFGALQPRPFKVPASSESLRVGDWLGCFTFETPQDWAAQFLSDMRETDPIYAREGLIHPGQLVRMLNWAVIDNVALVPWLYVGSTIHHLAAASVGKPLSVRAVVIKNVERKGHLLAELDGVIFSGGEPVARGSHTVIYQPRQAMQTYRGQAVTS